MIFGGGSDTKLSKQKFSSFNFLYIVFLFSVSHAIVFDFCAPFITVINRIYALCISNTTSMSNHMFPFIDNVDVRNSDEIVHRISVTSG